MKQKAETRTAPAATEGTASGRPFRVSCFVTESALMVERGRRTRPGSKFDRDFLSARAERTLSRFEHRENFERKLAVREGRMPLPDAAQEVRDRRGQRLLGGDALEIALGEDFRRN